ncbi:putative methyltransferase YcgJ [Corynebacterium cystitidis DSM 20524]|uniref:Methyltransferase domain-containing protein n=2 Tax=Corynebacterium cystitidis TaxID=35757 RepID=A0A1H9WIX6_9CORY|nr:putative methyltransferase YcgJ [Corynebacterium cystitidis DSM 20524]SES33637.1 Methyltransferase domain-containing protein [Corynebacterium cystitidis DSM 20524]SNV88630.1 SAM-dependent methyltransferase [Corynebacterium cystitidis]
MDMVQNKLDQYWDQRAQTYHADQTRKERAEAEREIWVKYLRRILPETPGQALDVGTGTGYLAHLVHSLGWDTTGIDTSQGMLRIAAAQGAGPRFEIGDATTNCNRFGTFDLVINRYVMWTLSDPLKAVRHWKEILNPQGKIVIIDALHFPHGMKTIEKNSTGEGTGAFARFYSPDVVDQLPLALARTVDDYTDVFHTAGAKEVTVTPVPEIVELGKKIGVAEGHDLVEPFIIAANF